MINEVFAYINNLSAGNQMIAGAISLWMMGVITYVCRTIPERLWKLALKHATTEFVTTSQNTSFFNLMKWFENEGYAQRLRRLKVSNGKWGDNNETIKSVGYGTHVVWYGWTPLWVTLSKEESHSNLERETVSILKIGRSHALFDCLIDEISHRDEKADRIEVYTEDRGDWIFSSWQPKRSFDSVVVKPETLQELMASVNVFIESEKWYVDHGIPYSLGILLHGPPGTGKTSMIRALASHTNRDIYMASATGVAWHPEILQRVNQNSITVIEDIDACLTATKRGRNRYQEDVHRGNPKEEVRRGNPIVPPRPANDQSDVTELPRCRDDEDGESRSSLFSTSDLLNALDGIVSSHGRILVMTTNYPERIDSAILRPGRCDLKLEIGYFDMEMFGMFLCRFFPDKDVMSILRGRELKPSTLTGANLQQEVLCKKTFEEIVSAYTRKADEGKNAVPEAQQEAVQA